MKSLLTILAIVVSMTSAGISATITIDGRTVGPGTAKMTVDGVSVGQSSNNNTSRTTTTTYSDGTTTRVYRNGLITKVYRNGVLTAVYQDGSTVDWSYYGNLINIKKDLNFDLRNESHPLHAGKFSEYFNAFLNNYKINETGRFTPATNARTPANQFTRDEFRHFVAEGHPNLIIESIDRCVRCSGSGHHTSLVDNIITEVQCVSCNGRGHVATTLNVALTNTGKLPARPTVKDFISIGLLAENPPSSAPSQESEPNEKKPGMLLDLNKIVPAPEKQNPVPAPMPTSVAEKKKDPEIQLTPMQRFQMTKGKAEAGNSQAQYELALFYLQEPEKPVPLDYFEAYNWMLKASMKNHRMAQYHLGRLYENGFGTEKNLESTVQWRRSAALLGCKQSQKWMGQLYTEIFSGNLKYATIIKPDPSNLIEAYAWNNLGSEIPFPLRQDPKTPGPEELESGLVPLNLRDYNFEKSIPTSAARDRDIIARNPLFTKKMYDDAKARCITLAKEAEEHLAQNRPK
jgi:hypothetical protein